MDLPKEARKQLSGQSHTQQRVKARAKSQSKGFQKKSGKLEVPHRLLMVHQFVLILLSNVVAKLWLKDPVARRDTTYAAFAMGRCV